MEFEIKNVNKQFGDRAILDIDSFRISSKDLIGVFGRNGCGKTTLFECISGQLKSDIRIHVNGSSIKPKELMVRQMLGYVPQDSFLPAHIRLRDLIPLYLQDVEKQDRLYYDSILSSLLANRPGELSFGERKYAELLLVGSLNRPLLLLDEPFTMLEPLQIEKAKEFISHCTAHSTIIITDHYYHHVTDISTKNYVMEGGSLIEILDLEQDLKVYDYLK